MIDAVREYSGVDFNGIQTDEEAKAVADEHEVHYESEHKRGDIINLFFEEYAEELRFDVAAGSQHLKAGIRRDDAERSSRLPLPKAGKGKSVDPLV